MCPRAYDHLMSLAARTLRSCRRAAAGCSWRRLPRGCWRRSRTHPTPMPRSSTLSRVSDSLGGKAALWELFSSNRPTLELYVKLCAACPYLAGILTSNPGMIDELLDSLLMDKLPDLGAAGEIAGRAHPRRRRPGADPAQLQARAAPARRRPRPRRQGRHPGHAPRTGRRRRGVPEGNRRQRNARD